MSHQISGPWHIPVVSDCQAYYYDRYIYLTCTVVGTTFIQSLIYICWLLNWQGNTKVLAAVYGPHEIRGGNRPAESALVNCQYSAAVFSTSERKRRPRGDRKSMEMTIHLKQTFEAVIKTDLYPRWAWEGRYYHGQLFDKIFGQIQLTKNWKSSTHSQHPISERFRLSNRPF
jgi:hypothetical protein